MPDANRPDRPALRCLSVWLAVMMVQAMVPPRAAAAKDPYLAGILAEVVPGAGYLYLGETRRAALAGGLLVPMVLLPNIITPSYGAKALKVNIQTATRNLHGFSVYDTFQAALATREGPPLVVDLPHYSLRQLAMAPVRARTYKSPIMWAPLALLAGVIATKFAHHGVHPGLKPGQIALSVPLILAQSLLIGIGEEAEFRGFQYPAFAQATGYKLPGNILQAASFGLCHTRWGFCSSPYLTGNLIRNTSRTQRCLEDGSCGEHVNPASPSDGTDAASWQYFLSTFAFGLAEGLVTSSSSDGLLRAVSLHAIWDATLILTDFLTTGNTGRAYMGVNVNF